MKLCMAEELKLCAWCYAPLEVVKMCAKCQKRVYCSRECQILDWKGGHKVWCGCAGERGYDFEVRDAGGAKGLGMFALVDLERGAKILAERAVVTKRTMDVSSLKPATLSAVMALLPEDGDLRAKIALNGMDVGAGFGDDSTGLFITMARVNHACLANAVHFFDADSQVKILVASRAIAKGDEVTVTYVTQEALDASPIKVSRKQLLAMKWHISPCDCRSCQDPDLDRKLDQVAELDKKLMAFGSTAKFDRGLKCGALLIKLYDELQESPLIYARTYYDMFQLAVTRRATLAKAKHYIKLARDNRALFLGPAGKTDDELLRFTSLVDAPQQHRNYLITER